MFIIPCGGSGVIAPPTTFQVSRSLRFNAADNDYLHRPAGGLGNPRVWTFSCWVKRGRVGAQTGLHQMIFSAFDYSGGGTVNRQHGLRFTPNDTLEFYLYWDGAGYIGRWETVAQFRDTTAWYHIFCFYNSPDPNAPGSSRMFTFVNGTKPQGVQSAPVSIFVPLNQAGLVNHPTVPSTHAVGALYSPTYPGGPLQVFEGLIADAHFIDGLKLTPEHFGMTDPATLAWVPKQYSGSHGPNGFYLNFSQNNTQVLLGADTSGNGNHYTPVNITVGIGGNFRDSMVDTPTNYGSPAANGGEEVRGNYCTLNTLDANIRYLAIPEAMKVQNNETAPGWGTVRGTMWVSSGKWYYETQTYVGAQAYAMLGVMGPSLTLAGNADGAQYPGLPADGYGWMTNGSKYNNGVGSAFGAALATQVWVGVALDLDAGTISIYHNGVLQGGGPMFTGLSGLFAPAVGIYWLSGAVKSTSLFVNFGQTFFFYPAPAGFKAWCTQNLPTPAIKRGDDFMSAKTRFTFVQGTQPYTVTGNRFSPDIVWVKNRYSALDHVVFDTSRGVEKHLKTNSTVAEITDANSLTSFNADGYSAGNASYMAGAFSQAVDMMWKKGAVPGVDVVLYTGTAAVQAVPHSLGAVPKMMLVKSRSTVVPWVIYHSTLGPTKYLLFDTAAAATHNDAWNNTAPTATHFTLPAAGGHNTAGMLGVAYVFAEVPGFSRFGAYTANNLADGPFAPCGFRPAWVMIKNTMTAGHPWHLYQNGHETVTSSVNVIGRMLFPNTNEAELFAPPRLDFLASGFKLRTDPGNGPNTPAGDVFIFAAFAEMPFKYAHAR